MVPEVRARRILPSTALAAALACVVLLTLLGHARLTDWDEGIYAGISAGISHATSLSGWVIPHWNGQPWLEKPPLELWLTALSFRVFGVGEFSARLVSALSGVALVALLHGWLVARRNALTAWLNTVILLSTFGFQHVARVGEMDVLLSLTCTLALIGLCELELAARRGWLLFWIGFAFALMTKGAASITLPITLALWLVWRGVRGLAGVHKKQISQGAPAKNVSAWSCMLGLVIFLAITLPWHLAVLHRFGRGFTAQYLGLHVLTRATSQIEGHVTPWYFYLRVLLLSAAPWVLLYPVAIWDALLIEAPGGEVHSQRLKPQDEGGVCGTAKAVLSTKARWPIHRGPIAMSGVAPISMLPFAVFSVVVLALFSFAQTRLPHYIAPAYLALSLLTAVWLADQLAPRLARKSARSFMLRFAAAALVCYGLAALVTSGPRKSLHAARLPNGDTTLDNREQIALLKQVFAHPTSTVEAIGGPLLTLRTGTYNPIPTTVFYSGRTVQQTALLPLPAGTPIDKYTNSPIPLAFALDDHQPHLLLADRRLLHGVAAVASFQPLATGQTLALGILTAR